MRPAATGDPWQRPTKRDQVVDRPSVCLSAEGPQWPPASPTRMLARGTKDPLDAGNRVKIPSMLMEDGGFISGIPACLFA